VSTVATRPGVWGLVEARLGSPSPDGEGLWDHLAELADPAEFRPKLAADIEVKQFTHRSGEDYYMVANPRDLVHYRLQDADYQAVKLMDGTRTVKEIVVQRFRDSGEMELSGLVDLVHQLHSENFLEDHYVDVDGMVKRELDPRSTRKGRRFVTTLSIEWKNPHRYIQWLHDHGLRWAFAGPFVLLSVVVSLAGMAAFGANVHKDLFGLTGKSLAIGFVVLLAIQYLMVGIHELGHALVLVHYGRRIKGAGFQIYFGCPAFYVDASDGLMMGRGKRVIQSFAGPYGQSIGAGLASIIAWLFPQWAISETLFRYTVLAYLNIFLNVIPILELDGYWMLSDFLRIPDLRPRSIQFIRHDLFHKLRTRSRFSSRDIGLLVYGVLGVLASILLLLSGYLFWKILFGGLVSTLWHGGTVTRLILIGLALFLLNPVIRGMLRTVAALGRRARALYRRIRFRLQRGWRVEAAELIDQLQLFDDVPEEVLSELAGRVKLRSVATGQRVVRQGERADAFYVVRKGVLEVVEEDPATGEDVRILRSLGRGEAFGELGLAQGAKRAASVRAVKESDLFVIDKGAFDELLADMLHVPEFEPTLQAVAELRELPCFAQLEPDELAELLDRGEWMNVPPGDVLIEQGEEADAFFAIGAGQVDVFEDGARIRTMGPGSHVGEIALLLSVARTATVRAVTPVRTFRLDRDGFDALIRESFRKGTLNPAVSLDRIEEH
jgi:putative peptide zinc metalloprotease protein